MNKSDLITVLADSLGLSHRLASSITQTVFDAMAEALSRGENVEIRGFGSFAVKEYAAYHGRNPKTGSRIEVAPKKLPFFKVGKELRERVNGGVEVGVQSD
ncbi:MAG: HU family DNA-binding protein [Thermodesulfobacteriota bacterium]